MRKYQNGSKFFLWATTHGCWDPSSLPGIEPGPTAVKVLTTGRPGNSHAESLLESSHSTCTVNVATDLSLQN